MIAPGSKASDRGPRTGGWRGRVPVRLGRTLAGAALVAVLGVAACDKVPLTAPSGSTVTLFSNTTIVPVNGTAEITATVIESAGTFAHNGTLVTFTTTIGALDPAEARTNNGKATVRLMAGGRSGRATLRAFSGGITSGDLTIDIGGAAAGRITLSANPSSVSAAGGTSTLLAVVFDVDGNRLGGVPVSFTATAGAIASSVIVSDANGEARTTITTNRDATVTATAGGSAAGAPVTAQATITAVALPTVGVTLQTTTPTVGQSTVFSVTASATAPNSIRNVTIDFGDGDSQSLGVVSTTSVSHAYRAAGTFTVTATAEDTSGARVSQSTSVVVSPAIPALVSLTAAPSTINPGEIVTFTVTVSPQGGSAATVQSVSFDFGDGNGSGANASLTRTHIYGQSGNFLAIATVRFTDGTTRTAEAAVRVR